MTTTIQEMHDLLNSLAYQLNQANTKTDKNRAYTKGLEEKIDNLKKRNAELLSYFDKHDKENDRRYIAELEENVNNQVTIVVRLNKETHDLNSTINCWALACESQKKDIKEYKENAVYLRQTLSEANNEFAVMGEIADSLRVEITDNISTIHRNGEEISWLRARNNVLENNTDQLALQVKELTRTNNEQTKIIDRLDGTLSNKENTINNLTANLTRKNKKQDIQPDFIKFFDIVSDSVHENAKDKGWWDEARNDGEMIALMHSELSEALEALREGHTFDKHCPNYSAVTVELADTIIRIMDFAQHHKLALGSAIVAKHEYNKTRAHKHGGKKF